jgi:hypothetical protein
MEVTGFEPSDPLVANDNLRLIGVMWCLLLVVLTRESDQGGIFWYAIFPPDRRFHFTFTSQWKVPPLKDGFKEIY